MFLLPFAYLSADHPLTEYKKPYKSQRSEGTNKRTILIPQGRSLEGYEYPLSTSFYKVSALVGLLATAATRL